MPCYFDFPIAGFRYPSTTKIKCGGDCISKKEFNLFIINEKELTEADPNDENSGVSNATDPDSNSIIDSFNVDAMVSMSIGDEGSLYEPNPNELLMDNFAELNLNSTPESTFDSISNEKKKIRALREIVSLYGLSRLTKGLEWKDLKPDTQRKKISAMIHLQDELYKLCAGTCWESMKYACIKKIGLITDCSRVTSILQSIDARLEQTTDRRSRLSLISIITGHFTEKEIVHATGVSRYFIREAKKYALYGLDELKNLKRLRYDHPNVKTFVSFISRPEIIVPNPKPARMLSLSTGDSIALAAVDRLHSYRYIHTMFTSFLETQGKEQFPVTGVDPKEYLKTHTLGYSSCVKIMEKLIPVRRIRMQCVDMFQSDALEAFETSLVCVSELKETGKIGDGEANDLRRRFIVAQNYLTGYYRMHLSTSSQCNTHCIRYALSDASTNDFRSECDHAHDEPCEQCVDILSVFAQTRSFLQAKLQEATANNDVERFRIDRMIQECDESEMKVFEYQKHVVRAALSELDRVSVIDSLPDRWALITMDFSLKLLPTGFVESQSQWFGKAGISFHVSHVLLCKAGTQLQHTLGHLNDDAKQDGTAICIIADHIFHVLADNGVTHLITRSDNAGSYRNAGVINTLRLIAIKYGIVLVAYLFSEPQAGKGAADRQISLAKCKIRSVVNSGGKARNAEEILKALCTAPLLNSYSFYNIKGEQIKRSETSIEGIGNLSSFRYEDGGIRVKKFDSIGDGCMIPYDKLDAVDYKYDILTQGGHLSKSSDFWGQLNQHNSTKKPEKKQPSLIEEEEPEKIFRCTEETCTMKYLTMKGLQDHLIVGKHKRIKHSDTIVDAAAKLFSECVETNETAYLSMKVDSLSSHPPTISMQLEEGWAIRVKNRTTIIYPSVRREVRKYFVERRKAGKRAEAKVIVQLLRNKRNADGSYVFPLKKCLKETQAQGMITRFLKVETSKKGLKALESEEEDGFDRAEELDPVTEAITFEDEPAAKRRGRPKKADLPTAKSKPTVKNSRSKKVTVKPRLKKQSVDESEEEIDDCDGRDVEATTSTASKKPTTRRGRPSTTTISKAEKVVKNCSGRKKKEEKEDNDITSRTTRVLRDRKRNTVEKKITYCEISTDDEVDDYTAMMNYLQEETSDEE